MRGEIAEAPPAGGKLCEAFGTAVAPSGELCYTAENAAAIPCRQVLGVYSVSFPGRTDREAPLTPCKSPENRVY